MRAMQRLSVLSLFLVALSAYAGDITRATVLARMNEYRVAHGVRPLTEDARLDSVAEDRMREMEDLAYWGHESPDGRSPFLWFRPRGYQYRYAGENLAVGFETVELLVASWMESAGHRDNILSPLFQDCGIAIIDGSTKGRASGRSVVVMFGRPATP